MKSIFEAPQLELNVFSVEDVVTTSTGPLNAETSGSGDEKPFDSLFNGNN